MFHNTCTSPTFINLSSNNTVNYLVIDNQGSQRQTDFPKATQYKQWTWNSNPGLQEPALLNISYIVNFKRNKSTEQIRALKLSK